MNRQLKIITRKAPLKSNTWDKSARTIEAVISTGAPVDRFDMRGSYIEKLSTGNQKWPERVPVIDAHDRGSMNSVLGHADNIRTEGDEVHATIHLSKHNPTAERLALELSDGAEFGISIGYSVAEWKETKNGEVRTKLATRWSLVELSFVPVAADPGATTRNQGEKTMPRNKAKTIIENDDDDNNDVIDRSDVNVEIRNIARVAGLDQKFIDTQIDAGASADQTRAAAFAAMQTRAAPTRTIVSTAHNDQTLDDPEVRATAMGEALFARFTPSHKLSDAAKGFTGMTMVDMARECLRANGQSVAGLNANTIVTRSLTTTSDYPMILGDTIGRSVRTAYEAAPSIMKQLARVATMPDFRARTRISTSQFSKLEKVNENGEFKRGNFIEGAESYKLATFGKIFGISRQAIINDNLGVFQDVPRKLGEAATNFEAQFLVDLLISNAAGPLMADGKRLFHVDHGNLAAAGAAPSELTLTAARLAMRAQKDESGQLITVAPKYLLIPSALETVVEKLLTVINATNVNDANPFAGKLTALVEPRLTSATAWYLVADPALIDGLEYAHLEGAPGPQIETCAGFDVAGVETRVMLDFGAGFLDYRSWYKNPG